MRAFLAIMTLVVISLYGQAQDAGMLASQMATQQTQMAAQQATQQAMSDTETAQNAMIAQQQATSNSFPQCSVATPSFSVQTGIYSSALTVTIRSSRQAAIFYTTDGWTPTQASTRYLGPITIDSTTTLQAMGVSPCRARSRIAAAVYTLNGVPALPPAVTIKQGMHSLAPTFSTAVAGAAASGKLLLAKDTPVPLVFTEDVNSKTAHVGDKISLALAEDVRAGDAIVAIKGTPSIVTLTEVSKPGMLGRPGEIVFVADSLQADGSVVKLRGTAAKQGQDETGKASALAVIPVPVALFVHGKNAEIRQGAVFTAFVDADTLLPPH
ncbi:MAG TPA: chitobiase/beta-hexosaminidase C-terminal domain-containing protein [Candidatus Sulfotelmatobacter sp.]